MNKSLFDELYTFLVETPKIEYTIEVLPENRIHITIEFDRIARILLIFWRKRHFHSISGKLSSDNIKTVELKKRFYTEFSDSGYNITVVMNR